MRARAVTTIFVWLATVIGIDRLLASVRYTEWIPTPETFTSPDGTIIPMSSGYYQTLFAPGEWQVAVVILTGMIVVFAGLATMAMWVNARDDASTLAAERIKQKRRDPQREARMRRLLDQMDDDELEALEQFEVGDDGERMTLDALLRRR